MLINRVNVALMFFLSGAIGVYVVGQQPPINQEPNEPSLLVSVARSNDQRDDQKSEAVGFEAVDFSRDIRPILSDTCFKCHGPDAAERSAGLRLDTEEGIQEDLGGHQAVVPGKLDESELINRLITDDLDLRMPPVDSGRELKADQIELLKAWVKQGAKWDQHWSFVQPTQVVPPVSDSDWVRSPIDQFILRKMQKKGLSPNPDAEKAMLLRRLSLDIVGLPPTLEMVHSFVADTSPDAYEKQVDQLLSSSQYGEHMARYWLDAARYGDTHGLHLDNYREMWLYRDWVVDAFNRNLSYDQFVTEQLAGDLLEQATQSQVIASGFNRAHVTTAEGGSISAEVDMRNVVDRTSTTGTVFMGLTVGCAVCHDHKYDPISQREFYQLYAFFNSIEGDPMDGNVKDHPPILRVLSDQQKVEIAQLRQRAEQLRLDIQAKILAFDYQEPAVIDGELAGAESKEYVWVDDQLPAGAKPTEWKWSEAGDGSVASGDRASVRTATGLSQHFFIDANPELQVHSADDILFAYVYLDPANLPEEVMLQWNNGDWNHRSYWGGNKIDWGADESASRRRLGDLPEAGKWVRLETKASDVGFGPGTKINGWAFTQFGGSVRWDKAGIVTVGQPLSQYGSLAAWTKDVEANSGKGLPDDIVAILGKASSDRNAEETTKLRHYFVENVFPESQAIMAALKQEMAKATADADGISNSGPTTLVSKELPAAKPAFVMHRGEYDQPGEPVERATPNALPAFADDLPRNRLGLAKWLVKPNHPLTSRVTVNRFWQQLFGTGLVKTSEDFGAQGQQPSHPELLDWLAVDFVENGWDTKRLVKQIVMSSTYRQSTQISSESLRIDPENRFLSRGARYRLDAETLRDQILFAAGLMNSEIGGPSVKPPQPDGLWFAVGYSGSNTVRFKKDDGHEKVHRRSLYTFWKRTSPPPQMTTFDAPSRESCTVRRERTNTPLQALLLMNEPQYVEASRYFAARVLTEGGQEDRQRVRFAIRLAASREASDTEVIIIEKMLDDARSDFAIDVDAAKALVAIGEKSAEDSSDVIELAAWTMVANLIFNLDEVVTKN